MKKLIMMVVLFVVAMMVLIHGFDYISANAGNIGGWIIEKFFELIKALISSK